MGYFGDWVKSEIGFILEFGNSSALVCSPPLIVTFVSNLDFVALPILTFPQNSHAATQRSIVTEFKKRTTGVDAVTHALRLSPACLLLLLSVVRKKRCT